MVLVIGLVLNYNFLIITINHFFELYYSFSLRFSLISSMSLLGCTHAQVSFETDTLKNRSILSGISTNLLITNLFSSTDINFTWIKSYAHQWQIKPVAAGFYKDYAIDKTGFRISYELRLQDLL